MHSILHCIAALTPTFREYFIVATGEKFVDHVNQACEATVHTKALEEVVGNVLSFDDILAFLQHHDKACCIIINPPSSGLMNQFLLVSDYTLAREEKVIEFVCVVSDRMLDQVVGREDDSVRPKNVQRFKMVRSHRHDDTRANPREVAI
jgi:hypothetical protein